MNFKTALFLFLATLTLTWAADFPGININLSSGNGNSCYNSSERFSNTLGSTGHFLSSSVHPTSSYATPMTVRNDPGISLTQQTPLQSTVFPTTNSLYNHFEVFNTLNPRPFSTSRSLNGISSSTFGSTSSTPGSTSRNAHLLNTDDTGDIFAINAELANQHLDSHASTNLFENRRTKRRWNLNIDYRDPSDDESDHQESDQSKYKVPSFVPILLILLAGLTVASVIVSIFASGKKTEN